MLCRYSCARAAVSAHGSLALWLQGEGVDAAARGAQQARPSRRPRHPVRCPVIGPHRQPPANRRGRPSTRPPAPLAKCVGRRAGVSASAAPSLLCTVGRVMTQSPLRLGAGVPLGAWRHASLWSRTGRSRSQTARRATGGLGCMVSLKVPRGEDERGGGRWQGGWREVAGAACPRPGRVGRHECNRLDLLVAQQPALGLQPTEFGVAQRGAGQGEGAGVGGGFVGLSNVVVGGVGGIGMAGQWCGGPGTGFQGNDKCGPCRLRISPRFGNRAAPAAPSGRSCRCCCPPCCWPGWRRA